MFSRRHVLKQLVALGAIAGFGSLPGARAAFAAGEPGAAARYHMPEESSPQALVWVAFGATSEIWGRHYKEVQATIGRLVQAMVPYTRVNVLCHEDDEALARQLCGERNTHFVHAEMDDIWLPGIKGRDITDAHVDFYARFVRPGVVVINMDNDPDSYDYKVTRQHLAILQQATDADGNKLELHQLPPPLGGRDNKFSRSPDFAAGYINYLPINGAVIAPQFGDARADRHCRDLLARLYPGRKIVQIDIDPVAAGGGGIHCITLHQPA